jgi:hypothetical protein
MAAPSGGWRVRHEFGMTDKRRSDAAIAVARTVGDGDSVPAGGVRQKRQEDTDCDAGRNQEKCRTCDPSTRMEAFCHTRMTQIIAAYDGG